MAIHPKRTVEELERRLNERCESLLNVMKGFRDATHTTATGSEPGRAIKAQDIRFAVDDVSTALKEIKSQLGKG
ncbi:hypothetical protein I5P84_05470 [Pseudomonas mosselii]|uniref:hypothetical protein n=1 Tax=Pseudomonas mosselii TaxID=78327 RepID=UPI0018D8CC15|nr:hypothetical protein [Pseudomonas mosselii]MBH3308903.1 hypothetical protein [Pseudomonas mosselii]MBH3325313.1 hypothetical protein [Pseudomonas mosselii]MEB5930977.1 hypothetical protein [Pseudomonas mosselii]